MDQFNPSWYDALQTDPFREKTFTDELAAKTRTRVISSAKRSVHRRVSFIAAALICMIGLILFVTSGILDKLQPATNDLHSFSSAPTDSQLLELINQGNPDPEREILYKETIDDSTILLFTKQIRPDHHDMIWEVGYARWTSGGISWVKEKEGEILIDFVSKSEFTEAQNHDVSLRFQLKDVSLTTDSSHLLFGSLVDPRVNTLRITDEVSGQHTAKLIYQVYGGYSLWFSILPKSVTKYRIERIEKDGSILPLMEHDSMDFPTNENGQTYGSASDAAFPATQPDLIKALGVDGTEGYVLKKDLDGVQPKTPEEALEIQKNRPAGGRDIPLYEVDGKTVIGVFHIGP